MGRLVLHSLAPQNLDSQDELLQTGFWGAFKSLGGWKPWGFRWEWEGESQPLLVLERRIAGVLPVAYVPMGPGFPPGLPPEDRSSFLAALGRELQGELSLGCLFVRFDLPWGTGGKAGTPGAEEFPPPLLPPLRRASLRVQPPDTVLLDLTKTPGELLEAMHKKTRYNIRLAEKRGVEVETLEGKAAEEALGEWYRIYLETARRDGLGLHGEGYYRRLFSLAQDYPPPGPVISLLLARKEGELLAGIILVRQGSRALYLYGASRSTGRELMPGYLLQWEAVKLSQAAGCREYDLFGIPPREDPSHPMYGLWRFKTGFGGRILHRLGAWDYPYSWGMYSLYRTAEKIRGGLAARRKPGKKQT